MTQPAPLSATAEAVLTFLESVGRRSEAEFYLRLFLDLPKQSFALIAPGAPVIRYALESLSAQLRFLADLGLYAPVILGVFDPEQALGNGERLMRSLPALGLGASLHDAQAPDLLPKLRAELDARSFPILHFGRAAGVLLEQRLSRIGQLARALETRKFVMLRRRGGLRAKGPGALELGPGHSLPTVDGRISIVNLRTDFAPLLSEGALPRRDARLLRAARDLIEDVEPANLLIAVASPLNLLKELFTVKGAGTLIKRGAPVERRSVYAELDVTRLRRLLEASFGRALEPDFFAEPPAAIFVEASYRGVALVYAGEPVPYLGKFAVLPDAQGEGIGRDLWQAMIREFPELYWRSRRENPVNPWYESICDGFSRAPDWQVFWRGVKPEHIPVVILQAQSRRADFGAALTPPPKPAGRSSSAAAFPIKKDS